MNGEPVVSKVIANVFIQLIFAVITEALMSAIELKYLLQKTLHNDTQERISIVGKMDTEEKL